MQTKFKLNRAFTLIELLVVISIIGILSSVALTSLSTSRAKAKDARTAQELHQIDLAIQDYYVQYGVYPICESGANAIECCIGSSSCIDPTDSSGTRVINDKLDFGAIALNIPNTKTDSGLAASIGSDLNFTDRNYVYYPASTPTVTFAWTQTNNYKTLPVTELYNFNQAVNVQQTNNDIDGDNVSNISDNCPSVANTDQANSDGDSEGNACDADDDNDGILDGDDSCPLDNKNTCTLVYGCTNSSYLEYNSSANTDDGSCLTLKIPGCTASNASNYNIYANFDDGSCYYHPGCTNPNATNYDPNADHDDGTCIAQMTCQGTPSNNCNSYNNDEYGCNYYTNSMCAFHTNGEGSCTNVNGNGVEEQNDCTTEFNNSGICQNGCYQENGDCTGTYTTYRNCTPSDCPGNTSTQYCTYTPPTTSCDLNVSCPTTSDSYTCSQVNGCYLQ